MLDNRQASQGRRTVARFQPRSIVAGLVLAGVAGLAAAHGGSGGGMGMGGGPGMMSGGGMGMMGDGAMGPGRMGGGPGMRGAQMERMLDDVNATAEQRAQIAKIWDAARQDLQALHQGGASQHQEMARLLAQPTIDAAAVEALRQQHAAIREQASKRMTQAMVEASRVLTPEQRKQFADRMAQRQAMMQRHQAERRQLEGARN